MKYMIKSMVVLLLLLAVILSGCNSKKNKLLKDINFYEQLIEKTKREIAVAEVKQFGLSSIDPNDELLDRKLTDILKNGSISTSINIAKQAVRGWEDELIKMRFEYAEKYAK